MQSPPAPRDPLAAALALAWEMSARPLPGALADDALRKRKADDVAEEEAIVEIYKDALGME